MNIFLTKQSIHFIKDLKKNNTVFKGRDWYQENKERYQEFIKQPLLSMSLKSGQQLQKKLPGLCVDPSKSLFRLHRDLRFTHDHRPFKEWIAYRLWLGTSANKKVRPSFYFHLETNELFLGAGKWEFSPVQLKKFREVLLNDYQTKQLLQILKSSTKTNKLYPPSLKKVPKKFQNESLFPEGFLYKGLCLYQSFPKIPKQIFSKDAANFCAKKWQTMIPFVEWLDENVCEGT